MLFCVGWPNRSRIVQFECIKRAQFFDALLCTWDVGCVVPFSFVLQKRWWNCSNHMLKTKHLRCWEGENSSYLFQNERTTKKNWWRQPKMNWKCSEKNRFALYSIREKNIKKEQTSIVQTFDYFRTFTIRNALIKTEMKIDKQFQNVFAQFTVDLKCILYSIWPFFSYFCTWFHCSFHVNYSWNTIKIM